MSTEPSAPTGRAISQSDLRERREALIVALLTSATSAFEKNHDFESARDTLDQATILDPDDQRIISLWNRLEVAQRSEADKLLRKAKQQVEKRSFKEAAASLDRLLTLRPDSSDGLRLRSTVQEHVNRYRWIKSPAAWQIASGVGIVATLIMIVIGVSFRQPEQSPETEINELLANAEAATRMERYEDAVSFYTELLEINPRNSDASVGLATAIARLDAQREEVSEAQNELVDGDSANSEASQLNAIAATGRIAGVQLEADPFIGQAGNENDAVVPSTVLSTSNRTASTEFSATRSNNDSLTPPQSAAPAPLVNVNLCQGTAPCGRLTIRVTPVATILFDDDEVAIATQGILRLPTGRHQIRLLSNEHEFKRIVTISPNTPSRLRVDLEDDGLPR
jgi:tetratricopeptide (TPR) repeat protein